CVKYLSAELVEHLRLVSLYPGRRDTREFARILEKGYAATGEKLLPPARRALVHLAESFYRKVFPPEPELDDRPFDFSDAEFLREFMRSSSNLLRSKGLLRDY